DSRINKAGKGHAEKANTSPKRYVREIRNAKVDEYDVGQEINVETFAVGDTVDVTGTSKGKGFAGSVKRHNYATGFMTHGSRFHRPGRTMAEMNSDRLFKGKELAGQKGSEQVTIQNLEIAEVDLENNIIIVSGNMPSAKKSLVNIDTAIKGT